MQNLKKYKIIIAANNSVFIEGVSLFLHRSDDFEIIGKYLLPNELFNYKLTEIADVVLIDIDIPFQNGILVAKRIFWLFPEKKILALSYFKEKRYIDDLKLTGIKGCVFKDEIFIYLKSTIGKVIQGEVCFPYDI
jgi:two-component system response regulator DegU